MLQVECARCDCTGGGKHAPACDQAAVRLARALQREAPSPRGVRAVVYGAARALEDAGLLLSEVSRVELQELRAWARRKHAPGRPDGPWKQWGAYFDRLARRKHPEDAAPMLAMAAVDGLNGYGTVAAKGIFDAFALVRAGEEYPTEFDARARASLARASWLRVLR